MAVKHAHDFKACGYDAQQCDNACQAEHECSVCGKSRSELAKDLDDVRQHVTDSAREIIKSLEMALRLPLPEVVEAVKDCSKKLDWLSREHLVEMAVSNNEHDRT